MKRILVFGCFLFMLAIVVNWQHGMQLQTDFGPIDSGPLIEFPEIRHPSETDIRRAAELKAVEYASMFIVSGLAVPASAIIQESELTVQETSPGHWEGSGVIEHHAADGSPIRSTWKFIFIFKERGFSPVRAELDGVSLLVLKNH